MVTGMIEIIKIRESMDRIEGGLGDIDSLVNTMGAEDVGQIQAISVRVEPDGTYSIMDGRRRLEAARRLEWDEIRADVYDIDEEVDGDKIELAANACRLDMHPLDEAVLFQRRIDAGETIENIAAMYMRSRSAVYQRLALTKLVDEVKDLFRSGRLTITQAAAVADFDDESQRKIAEKFGKTVARYQSVAVPSWEFANVLSVCGKHVIGDAFAKKTCEDCRTRTHHSDSTLFPELEQEKDYCLDGECYCAKYREDVIRRVRASYEDAQVGLDEIERAPYVIVSDATRRMLPDELEIDGVTFPVTASSIITVEEYIDEETLEKIGESMRHNGIDCSTQTRYDMIHFVFDSDLSIDEEDGEEEKQPEQPLVPCETAEEKKLYERVVGNRWEISRFIKNAMIKDLATKLFGSDHFNASALHHFFFSHAIEPVSTIFKAYDNTLNDDIIQNGYAWLERFDIDTIRKIALDIQLYGSLSTISFWWTNPIEEEDAWLLSELGFKSDEVYADYQNRLRDEIVRRMNGPEEPGKTLEPEAETETDDESEAIDDEADDEEPADYDTDEGCDDEAEGDEPAEGEEESGGAESAEPFPDGGARED